MRKVFRFTIGEATKGKSFLISTLGVSIFLFLAGFLGICAMSYFQGNSESEKEDSKQIQTLYIVNETGYDYLDFSQVKKSKVVTEDAKSIRKKIHASKEEDAMVRCYMDDESMGLKLEMPEESEVTEDTCYEELEKISTLIHRQKLAHSQISPEKLQVVMAPLNTEYTTVGKEPESVGSMLTKTMGPLLIIMVLYFMVIVYGQSIAKTVTAEKTSKLMETLLLCVKPSELLAGKISAMALVGIGQFIVWILGLVAGLVGGHYAGIVLNSKFNNPIVGVLNGIHRMGVGSGFTVPAIIMAVLAVCLGFVFYCVVAGIVASRISKAEDLSQGMGGYQIIVVIGFFGSYFPSLQGKESLLTVLRWFPLTSAFSMPGDILLGNVSILMGLAMMAVLLLVTIILVGVAGRMYRNQVFYQR